MVTLEQALALADQFLVPGPDSDKSVSARFRLPVKLFVIGAGSASHENADQSPCLKPFHNACTKLAANREAGLAAAVGPAEGDGGTGFEGKLTVPVERRNRNGGGQASFVGHAQVRGRVLVRGYGDDHGEIKPR